MSLPLLVMTKVAVPVLFPVHTPVADKAEAAGGVFVGVLVIVTVGVTVGVFVGVLVGRARHDPTVLNVTEERKVVLYVTVITALPAPFKEMVPPGCRLMGLLRAGSVST
jgi:NhaP-type Na+/H+ or K+/H+ antiporter